MAETRTSRCKILLIFIAGSASLFVALETYLSFHACESWTVFGLEQRDVWKCSDIGPYREFHGVWVNGFEESRFFPNGKPPPINRVPNTDTRLLISDAARRLLDQQFSEASHPPIERELIEIRFMGNELRPKQPIGMAGDVRRLFAVKRILSAKLLARTYPKHAQ